LIGGWQESTVNLTLRCGRGHSEAKVTRGSPRHGHDKIANAIGGKAVHVDCKDVKLPGS